MKTLITITMIIGASMASAQVGGSGSLPVTCPPGDISTPSWNSNTNRLTSTCPVVKVGIGTYQPTAQLHIVSENESTSLRIQTTTFNNAELAFQSASNQSDILFESPSGSLDALLRYNLEPSGPSLIFQSRTGTSPFDLFKVNGNGTIYGQELIVRASPFPDYVFKPDYSLMSLTEVANYIENNGHLPNVPSALEVENNGLEIGAMQVTQMEKIEELYLYVIQLSERIESLERENDELKKSVDEKTSTPCESQY